MADEKRAYVCFSRQIMSTTKKHIVCYLVTIRGKLSCCSGNRERQRERERERERYMDGGREKKENSK